MLDLLNTRIKEMLGEDIKKLRDKMDQLSEAKKGVRDVKHTKKAKSPMANKDYDGDGKVETGKDEVMGSRMKAAAKAGKPFKEAMSKKCCCSTKGEENCPVHGMKEVKMADLPSRTVKGSSYGNQSDYKKPPEDARRPAKTMPAKKDKKPLGEAGKKPDFLDMDKDGNKKEPMKKAVADKKAGPKKGVNPFAKKKVKEAFSTFKHNVQFVNESLGYLLQEDEEGKAKAITAAGDMVNDFTSWMQRVGQYQTKTMIELADAIKADFGAQEAEAFKAAVGPALSATLETLTQQREAVSGAVAALAGEATPDAAMGMEPEMPPEPGMDIGAPDAMNPEPGGDEFGAADAAAGMGTTGREMRESKFVKKLKESHDIMASLAK